MQKSNSIKTNPLQAITTYQVGALEALSHRALRKFKDNCLREFGITSMQWYVIGTIHDSGKDGIRLTELSSMFDTTKGFMTNTINLLESRGILERIGDTTDNRVKYVRVTRKFRPVCIEIETVLRAKLRQTFYDELQLGAHELTAYVATLEAFAKLYQRIN